jgi:hypothetical protein
MYLLLYYPFINHVIEFIFFHIMVNEIVLNNEIQIFFFSNQFIKRKKLCLCTLLQNFKFKF